MNNHHQESPGFSLIEVLIALVILSVGLLGLAGLQTSSLHANDGAYLRTQANVLAYNLFDRMRANVDQAKLKAYDRTMSAPLPTASFSCVGTTADCSASQLAQWGLSQWMSRVTTKLPQGKASVTTTPPTPGANINTKVTVKLEWLQRGLEGNEQNSTASLTVTTAF